MSTLAAIAHLEERFLHDAVELDAPLDPTNADAGTLADLLGDHGDGARRIHDSAVQRALQDAVDSLPVRLRAIVALRFGLRVELTREETAEAFVVATGRVAKLEGEAFAALRDALAEIPPPPEPEIETVRFADGGLRGRYARVTR